MRNKDVTDEEEILRLVSRGRWYIRNAIIPAIQMRKYRSLKKRYNPEEGDPPEHFTP